MELQIVLAELEAAGKPQYRKIYARHGAREPMYGVLFSVLTAMHKRIKKDHVRALAIAAHIGKVNVDLGETGCITPDAAAYMHKTLAHRAAKAKK